MAVRLVVDEAGVRGVEVAAGSGRWNSRDLAFAARLGPILAGLDEVVRAEFAARPAARKREPAEQPGHE